MIGASLDRNRSTDFLYFVFCPDSAEKEDLPLVNIFFSILSILQFSIVGLYAEGISLLRAGAG